MKLYEKVLKVLIETKQDMSALEIKKYLSSESIPDIENAMRQLIVKNLVRDASTFDGISVFANDNGFIYFQEQLEQKTESRIKWLSNFFNNFISGFLSGLLSGLLLAYLVYKFGLN